MRTTLELPSLDKLQHRAFATSVVDHLDDCSQRDVGDQLGDQAVSVIPGLSDLPGCVTTGLAGDPHALTEHDRVMGPDHSEPYDSKRTVTASAGDVA